METTIKSWYDTLGYYIQNKQEYFKIGISQQTEISYGWDNDINKEYCDEHNIPYYNMNRDGGTIIHFKGNIAFAWIYDNRIYKTFMLVLMLQDFVKYLKSKGLNAELDHNDIMIDGYKLGSGHSYNLQPDYKWTYEAIQISMNIDLDLIKNVCKKEMKKTPKGLTEYGITTEEVLDFVNTWLEQHKRL